MVISKNTRINRSLLKLNDIDINIDNDNPSLRDGLTTYPRKTEQFTQIMTH